MQQKLNRWFVYEWGKPPRQKPHRVILRSPLPRIYYYQSQAVTSIKNHTKPFSLSQNTNLQLNPYPNTQLDLYCSGNLSFQCTNPSTWLTNDAWIPIHDYLLYTNPNTWLTLQQHFDWCSWFATASHRNTNKIFKDGVRNFAWLQNLKVYKKRNKNSFFYWRRLGFQKENLINLSRIRFFFFHLAV